MDCSALMCKWLGMTGILYSALPPKRFCSHFLPFKTFTVLKTQNDKPTILLVTVYLLSSPVQLFASLRPPLPLLLLRPHPLVSGPTACCWPTELLENLDLGLCRSPGDTKGSPRWADRSSPLTSSPDTNRRRCACSGAPGGSSPPGSRATGRRYIRHPHREPWSTPTTCGMNDFSTKSKFLMGVKRLSASPVFRNNGEDDGSCRSQAHQSDSLIH